MAIVDDLVEKLRRGDPLTRSDAAQELGRLRAGAADVVLALSFALSGDPHWGVRWAAADALSQIGSPAVPALIEALEHHSTFVNEMAIRALGVMGSAAKAAIPALCKARDNGLAFVRDLAICAIHRINSQVEAAAEILAVAPIGDVSSIRANAADVL